MGSAQASAIRPTTPDAFYSATPTAVAPYNDQKVVRLIRKAVGAERAWRDLIRPRVLDERSRGQDGDSAENRIRRPPESREAFLAR
jgi:hypothetical protein